MIKQSASKRRGETVTKLVKGSERWKIAKSLENLKLFMKVDNILG